MEGVFTPPFFKPLNYISPMRWNGRNYRPSRVMSKGINPPSPRTKPLNYKDLTWVASFFAGPVGGGETPVPSPTPSPTPIPPTPTPTPSPTPLPACDLTYEFVYEASISPTGTTQYYDVVLTGSSNLPVENQFVWTLTDFYDTTDTLVSSYTGNPLTEGYFTSTGSSNVSLSVIGEDIDGNPYTATTTDFNIQFQQPITYAGGGTTGLSSTDLLNWSATSSPLGSMSSVDWGARTFLFTDGRRGTFDRVATLTGTTIDLGNVNSSGYRYIQGEYVPWLKQWFNAPWEDTQPFYSNDAVNWSATTGTLPNGNYLMVVDRQNELMVLNAGNGDIYTSYSGGSYTLQTTLSASTTYRGVIRNETLNKTFIHDDGGNSLGFISTDNITWTGVNTTMVGSVWNQGACYRPSDGRTLIVSFSQAGGVISDDLINWSATTLPNIDGNFYLTCEYVPAPVDLFVAVSRTGKVVTSPDGITWTQRTQTANVDVFDIAYGYLRQ